MHPVFADPKTDVVFKRIFGAEARKPLLIALLNDLLELARGIVVPETARERILAEKELVRLERWLEKASTVPSIAEVIDDPS